MFAASPFWAPHVYADRRAFLVARGKVTAAVRGFFAARDFMEVETAILQVSPGNETHLQAFSTELRAGDGRAAARYLHTSPEFACKKLLAAGEARLFTLARCFRNGEASALHHPEFTMLEWYRAGKTYAALMDDCAALLAESAEALGCKALRFQGKEVDPFAALERLSVAEAFTRFAGIDLCAALEDREAFAAALRGAGIRVAADDTWSDLFTRVMVEKVEPHLGQGRATVLYDYPVAEAALARVKPEDGRFAERFELYACGVELANGFSELTDAAEQRQRFSAQMDEKERLYGERYPLDEDFLAALDIMPEAAGIALGFDRLVMLLTGASRIEHVLWTPVMLP